MYIYTTINSTLKSSVIVMFSVIFFFIPNKYSSSEPILFEVLADTKCKQLSGQEFEP